MPRRLRYRFVIDEAFTPDSLPMARLAEYMADLAVVLGQRSSVHFVAIESGTTVLVQEVEWEAAPKVRERIRSIRHRDGPPEALRAYESLNRRLAEDNGAARLLEDADPEESGAASYARILEFPGRHRLDQPEYGPFNQPGALQGIVIVVGGESDPVPVHLQDGPTVHICRARRPLARRLAQHLFTTPLRVTGMGRWFRDSTGLWHMRSFVISDFAELSETPLTQVVDEMRRVPGEWKKLSNPLRELRKVRTGDG